MTPQEKMYTEEDMLREKNISLKDGLAHRTSSQPTVERLEKLEKAQENQSKDHDILIELRTEMTNVRRDIKELADGTVKRIELLEKEKADRKEIEEIQKKINELQDKINKDIEVRTRSLEEAKIEPNEHRELMKSTNTNGIYLKWGIALIAILIGIMSWHIIGYKM